MPRSKRYIYTIGYGNRNPATLLEHINTFKVDYIIDVRRADAKSWCSLYHKANMGKWIEEADTEARWIDYSCLAKPRDMRMVDYRKWLNSEQGKEDISDLADDIEVNLEAKRPCLLCAELEPYVQTGGFWQVASCHRVYVAFALEMELMGGAYKWTVQSI